MTAEQFNEVFFALTGDEPLSWQRRLFHEYFVKNKLSSCSVIDLPTGLGKTMVMAIWLIARAVNEGLPRRLIYVVDRRTVVDQATALAESLRKQAPLVFPRMTKLAVSTLRGELADNREWSRDLSAPAIIIGTVDLIGSALLFSGYRAGYKRRPLEAGLLGQDSLLVLDEAHLSRPFEKLLGAIGQFNKPCTDCTGKPMRVIRMSATSSTDSTSGAFWLEGDMESRTGDFGDDAVRDRYTARKQMRITPPLDEKDKLTDRLSGEAIKLAEDGELSGKRIVVFVRKPDDARAVATAIREHVVVPVGEPGSNSKKTKTTPYVKAVEVLTGTMRGLERDKLVKKPVFQERWLKGNLKADDPTNQAPVFLVSTSAGEVGFDLNADHMVCDATTIDSLIQRVGRVNRRGSGDATVVLVREPVKMKNGKPVELSGLNLAIANTLELIEEVRDASPQNIGSLKSGIWKERYAHACSPEVSTVELTDVLLDAWSMTSITDRMPGRPEVGPWLRGIDDGLAQTTVAWRGELELFRDGASWEKSLIAVFAKHPIRAHESLTVNTGHLIEFLKRVAKLKDRPSDLMSTRAAVRLPRGHVVCRTIQQLIDEPGILYADSILVLPAKFGGLDSSGMLDADSIPKKRKHDDPDPPSLDVADHVGYEQIEALRSRLRIIIKRSGDGSWTSSALPGAPILNGIHLDEVYATSAKLFDDLKRAGLRVRLRQPMRFDVEGDAIESLVALGPALAGGGHEDQSLTDHVCAVEAEAKRIADALGMAEDDPVRIALLFAAKWHDEGKKAEIWQRFVYGKPGAYKGKSSKTRDPKSLRGYRHEFGSLLRVHHPSRCGTTDCELPSDADTCELALHLIATHHGMSRPHFSTVIYHDFTDAERDAIHSDAIRRFARLQRKHGWWHLAWLENLLRCADALASADPDADDDPAGATDEEGDAK